MIKDAANTNHATLAAEAFAALGGPTLAYIKAEMFGKDEGFAIHGADGRLLGAAPTRELAFAAARQHNLEPVSVH
ncbi:MAG: DUF1150 family protein [Alphaproteobacteria bacterium]|nr:DUF1150 family protein [Alphaproteobacteria bacterium]